MIKWIKVINLTSGGNIMCGRFQLYSDIQEIVQSYNIEYNEIDVYDKGDFYPSQKAPIVIQDNIRTLKAARWGFDLKDKKKLVINARAESVMNKPMFKNSIYTARCIVPANLFYEWKDEGDSKKAKYGIRLKNNSLISLGGIYRVYLDESLEKRIAFVIITTEADDNLKDIHPRMPLIIKDDLIDYWLDSNTSIKVVEKIINSNRGNNFIVDRYKIDEQLRMF
jgi:putative SOS response-associated peptidase YedK